MTRAREGNVRFSLVLATVDRVETLDRMLASLATQSYADYELIIVDQNPDDRLRVLLEKWQRVIPLTRVQSRVGLSRARNAGIAHARGELIGFPDDDCWYPRDLLTRVSGWFDAHRDCPLLCVGARNEDGLEVVSRWPARSCTVNRATALRACVSFCMFLPRRVVTDAGGFDEDLGVGSGTRFQSGEESDLALRVIARISSGWFEKSMWAYHPRKDPATSSSARALAYGEGFGYLLRKHEYGPHLWLYHVLRALGGAAGAVCRLHLREARFYWNSARGRVAGYLAGGQVFSERRAPSAADR
jgi:glycosyltransferase involved in cell wall biosynthesis